MPFRHGKAAKVLINQFDVSSYLNDGSVSQSIETGETTNYGSGGVKTYVVGLTDSTLSLSGLWDGAASAIDEIVQAQLGTDPEVVTFAPEGLTAGRRLITCTPIATSYEVSSPVADVVSISFEAQSSDRLDRGISLSDLTSISATGNGTSQDNTVSTSNGGVGTLHVPVNTRNGATTFLVQHSADNSTWATLVTFTSVGSTTVTSERVAVTGTVNRYLRVQYTVAGTTGALTFHASFARR